MDSLADDTVKSYVPSKQEAYEQSTLKINIWSGLLDYDCFFSNLSQSWILLDFTYYDREEVRGFDGYLVGRAHLLYVFHVFIMDSLQLLLIGGFPPELFLAQKIEWSNFHVKFTKSTVA